MIITGTTYSVAHYEEYKKTGNLNIFEEVIDSMILNGIAGMNDSFRNAISNLPVKDKRMAILSLLDKDLNLFKKIKALTNKNIDRLEHIKDIILMLREYVKVGEVEKKKFGEVMTPLELVKEMLATLPEEVWSNPNLKWLDPANGTGPYPAVVTYKLMKGLEEWEPDAEKRYKHIIENMIYTCELQAKNVFLWLCVADPFDEYTTNTYWGSFLDERFDKHMKDVWGIDKFDIVIGNPPYQEIDKNNKSKSGGNSLWSKFVSKSLKLIFNGKYICFIHPSSWMSPSGNTSKNVDVKINKYDILHLEVETAKKYFSGVGSNFTWYCLRKSNTFNFKTKIKTLFNKKNYEFEYNISKYDYLPIFLNKDVLSLQDKFISDLYFNFIIDYSFDQRKEFISKNNDGKSYPLFHTSNQILYSSKKHKCQDNKKIIVTKSGNLSPIYDENGLYGTTETSAYHIVENDEMGYFLLKLLKTKLYKFYLNTFKWSGFHNPIILNKLPIPNLNYDFTDEQLFDYFNLTEEERNLVLNYDKK